MAAQPQQYVAGIRLTVKTLTPEGKEVLGPDGAPTYREVKRGEPVPEARFWPNLTYYVQARQLVRADQFEPDPPSDSPAPGVAGAAAAEARRGKQAAPARPAAASA